ncbi:hypothetical protein BRL93_10265 [Xanthomonas oryzae pv. oryzae]|nr:hypothetical protein BRL93_10265 [Xanthomonas oryzae pv. oryzae]
MRSIGTQWRLATRACADVFEHRPTGELAVKQLSYRRPRGSAGIRVKNSRLCPNPLSPREFFAKNRSVRSPD